MNERQGQLEGPPPGKGLAKAALALGLCSLIPFVGVFCAILAIIFAFMSMARKGPGRNRAVVGLVVASVGVLESAGLMFLLVRRQSTYPFGRTTGPSFQVRCGVNLKILGENVALYMAGHDDVPPPDISVLVNSQGMSPEVLECPAAYTPGRPSVFVFFPKTGDVPGTTLMACDYRGNHPQGQRVVLRFDGKVVLVKTEAAFQAELARPENAAFAAALRAKEGPQE